jgi:hypothetical protein
MRPGPASAAGCWALGPSESAASPANDVGPWGRRPLPRGGWFRPGDHDGRALQRSLRHRHDPAQAKVGFGQNAGPGRLFRWKCPSSRLTRKSSKSGLPVYYASGPIKRLKEICQLQLGGEGRTPGSGWWLEALPASVPAWHHLTLPNCYHPDLSSVFGCLFSFDQTVQT